MKYQYYSKYQTKDLVISTRQSSLKNHHQSFFTNVAILCVKVKSDSGELMSKEINDIYIYILV